jgi:hypothetical protein
MNSISEDMRCAKHVIGLDIGDGESTLAWAKTGHVGLPQVYQRQRTAERSILTCTARHSAGYLFGEEAVLAKDVNQFRINFKEHGQPTGAMLFGQALLSEFFEANPDVQEDCLIFIGHPAGWPEDAIRVYRSHLELIAPSVYLLPESQSALVYVRDRDVHRFGALDNVLVVDIGSSTVDFTIVEDMIPRNISVGADLGCSEIDRQLAMMVKTALADNSEFAAALANCGSEDFLLLACRRAKEAQFSGRRPSLLDNRSSHDADHASIADIGFGWLREQDIRSLVTQSGGWASKFEQLVTEVRSKLSLAPEFVILTGGGSRMPFTWDICQLTFHEAMVERDADPSLSVARGLASAGCQRVHAARFRDDIRSIVTATETRLHVRAQTENSFSELKCAVAEEMRRKQRKDWPSLMTNPPKQEQVVRALQNSINAYLVPQAQKICEEYEIDSSLFGINFALPQLLATEFVTNLSTVSGIMEEIGGVAAESVASVAWQFLRHSTGNSSIPGLIGMAAFEGGLELYKLQKDIKKLLAAELPAGAAEQLIDEILSATMGEMEKRAEAVERFVM